MAKRWSAAAELERIDERQAVAAGEFLSFVGSSDGQQSVRDFWLVALGEASLNQAALQRGAASFVNLLDRHPAAGGRRARTVGRPVFPQQRGYNDAIGEEVGTLAALGAVFLGAADRTSEADFDRLWTVIAGADRFTETLRNTLLGRLFEPPPRGPRGNLFDLGREFERRNCFSGVFGAHLQVGRAFQSVRSASYATGISALDPPRGCTGERIIIRGSGFGTSQPQNVEVYFPARAGGCTRARVISWSDTAITVEVPDGVGTGCVGFVEDGSGSGESLAQAIGDFVGTAADCLGPMVGERIRATYERLLATGLKPPCPPCLPLDANRFTGGAPVVRSFYVDDRTGAPIDVAAGETFTLIWDVENATDVVIERAAVSTQLNELPQLSGPFDPASGQQTLTIPPAAGVFPWLGSYRLTATNPCGSVTATITFRMRVSEPAAAGGFFWGVADAGRQVEGNLANDDWEIFTSDPQILTRLAEFKRFNAPTINPQRAESALNHWTLPTFIQSVERIRALGLNAYRFSIEWSRIEPSRGNFDVGALANYRSMIDAVRARGMEPIVALNHLSLPAWVLTPPRWSVYSAAHAPGAYDADPGFKASLRGWEAVDTITAYVNYVKFVVASLPSVRYWITFNEPMSTSILTGYLASVFPPGFLGDGTRALDAIKNIVAAHAQAYLAIKVINPAAQVGITDQWLACKPTLNSLATAKFVDYHQDFLIRALVEGQVKLTSYQGTVLDERLLSITDADWTPVLDFFGLQYYKSAYPYYYAPIDLKAPYVGARVDLDLRSPDVNYAHDGLLNDMGWEMFPQGLYDCLMKLKQIAKFDGQEIPILVAENGMAEIRDHNRAAYLTAHVEQLQRAQTDGARVIGYLHWSSADNWEWIDGYRPEARFGLFSVDHDPPNNLNKPRRITDGALAFSHVMSGNPATTVPDAVSRFGRYTVDGTKMDVPTMSPFGTFTGTVGLDTITLLLSTSPPGTLFGMLFYHDTRRWLRLPTIHWDAMSRTLQFAHAAFSAAPQVAERFFSCVLDAAGNQGTGEACEVLGTNVTAERVDIVRVPLAGVWQSDPVVLSLSRCEGEWDARVFGITNKGDWTTMRGVAAGLNTAPITFVGSIAPAALPFNSGRIGGTLTAAGTLEIESSFPQPDGSTTKVLERLPDGLPF